MRWFDNRWINEGALDISGIWAKGLRPKKFRMKFDNATADVSLTDTNGVEIYASATYASGDEVYLTFAGADMERLTVSGSGDITDIEFLTCGVRKVLRKQPPGGAGNFRRPYLEGNPSYVEDNLRYPDVALANAKIKATGKVAPHMTFKQPYRYEDLQKMKYRNEPAFPHEEERLPEETPASVGAGQIIIAEPDPISEPVFFPEADPIPEPDPIPEVPPAQPYERPRMGRIGMRTTRST